MIRMQLDTDVTLPGCRCLLPEFGFVADANRRRKGRETRDITRQLSRNMHRRSLHVQCMCSVPVIVPSQAALR